MASAEAREVAPDALLTDSGWFTGLPTVSPDGTRLAWAGWPASLQVAALTEEGLGEPDRVHPLRPESLAWLDDDTLVYARNERFAGGDRTQIFALELRTGREERLTSAGGAHLPRPLSGGCVLYVRDVVTEGSSLRRWCPAGDELVWQAPEGSHVVGLAASPAGRIALALWSAGGVDLALLEDGGLRWLTRTEALELDPAWLDEETLLFRSDRDGLFDLYAHRLAGATLRLTRSPGGAFAPTAAGDRVVYAALGPGGFDLAAADLASGVEVEFETAAELGPEEPPPPTGADLEVRRYNPLPSLLPYGWRPNDGDVHFSPLGVGLELALVGQDASSRHRYALAAGYDTTLSGYLAGGWTRLRYDYGVPLKPDFRGGDPVTFGVEFGMWPHSPHLGARRETAVGVRGRVASVLPLDRWTDRWTARLGIQVGVVHLRSAGGLQPDAFFGASVSRQFADAFGYRTRGPRFGLTGVWSATPTGASPGLWSDAAVVVSLDRLSLPGVADLALRAGYRIAPPVPVDLAEFAAVGTAGYRASIPVALRYGDGLYAVERITLEPRARIWLDGDVGFGADVSALADVVLLYGGTASFGVTVGHADGLWFSPRDRGAVTRGGAGNPRSCRPLADGTLTKGGYPLARGPEGRRVSARMPSICMVLSLVRS